MCLQYYTCVTYENWKYANAILASTPKEVKYELSTNKGKNIKIFTRVRQFVGFCASLQIGTIILHLLEFFFFFLQMWLCTRLSWQLWINTSHGCTACRTCAGCRDSYQWTQGTRASQRVFWSIVTIKDPLIFILLLIAIGSMSDSVLIVVRQKIWQQLLLNIFNCGCNHWSWQ